MTILEQRDRQPEWMDQPDLEKAPHVRALRGLERINWWSRSAAILWPTIRRAALTTESRIRLLDVATGAGDIPLRLWSKSRKTGIDLEITGCDLSETALEHARRRADEAKADITFFQIDAVNEPLPSDYEVITCSLFLHHLDEKDVVHLLQKAGDAARHLLLINDLRRSFWGWWLAWGGTRVLSRSPIVHFDGPASVRAAFTTDEMIKLAQKAGLDGATIECKWPFRFLLSWRRT